MAPSGLTTVVAITSKASETLDLDDDFRWAGDKSGVDYCDYHKSNKTVAPHTPSCSSVVVSFILSLTPPALPTADPSSIVTNCGAVNFSCGHPFHFSLDQSLT
jgi:hypothetical protein